ncbi:Copper amine oxidase N-terminal domain-containing protein [Paenibacillus sp. 1_12]|uniref:stalk domain-containing protein n=1 Tax=Paenibacillus sp. 1_12 TaxID=1566278 RepID=UPI0008F1A863|nr:stalk domain-containing protein [Paenibacillus sp. 1_12]SFL26449.1 Copper amine oxidase N-terminal domain-containing protein [Paenibacillus sp. 1_12]
MKQKHWLSPIMIAILMCAMLLSAAPALAADTQKTFITMDNGIQINGNVLVPLTDFAEKINARVETFKSTDNVNIFKNDNQVSMQTDSPIIQYRNAQNSEGPTKLINKQQFAPIRLISEAFGYKFEINQQTKQITIENNDTILHIISYPYLELDGEYFVYDGELDNGLPQGNGKAVKGTSMSGEIWYSGQWSKGIPVTKLPVMEEAPADVEGYKIFINSNYLKSENTPITHNDAIYLPLGAITDKLTIPAVVVNGIIRINTPSRIILLRTNSDLMTYFDTTMKPNSARLEYPPILVNGFIYVPLVFLTDYMDMKVVWGEQQRIDITAGEFRRNASWGKQAIVDEGIKKLKFETDAEQFWKNNPVLWIKNISQEMRESQGYYHNFQQVSIVGYNGGSVTVSNGHYETTEVSYSMNNINATFSLIDPLAEYDWSESIKDSLRVGRVTKGMTAEQVILSSGYPDKRTTIGDLEQWYYKGIGGVQYSRFLYFKDGLFYK